MSRRVTPSQIAIASLSFLLIAGAACGKDDGPPPRGQPADPATPQAPGGDAEPCRRACIYSIDGAIAEMESNKQEMKAMGAPDEIFDLAGQRDGEIAKCTQRCSDGKISADCLLGGKTIADWSACHSR